MASFLALDFETANRSRTSACAVALVKVSGNRIVKRARHLIRPPTQYFEFTYLHGISWRDVEGKPSFEQLWPRMKQWFKDVDFIAAHNASFDRSVLYSCCEASGVREPLQRFICTVQLARHTWNIYPTKLPHVCDYLGIDLNHHEALSDAEACAKIVIEAERAGIQP